MSYLHVLDAELTLVQAGHDALTLTGAQASATVVSICALGGGWSDAAAAPVAIATLHEP